MTTNSSISKNDQAFLQWTKKTVFEHLYSACFSSGSGRSPKKSFSVSQKVTFVSVNINYVQPSCQFTVNDGCSNRVESKIIGAQRLLCAFCSSTVPYISNVETN